MLGAKALVYKPKNLVVDPMVEKKKRKWDSIARKWADEVEGEDQKSVIAACVFKPMEKNPYYLLRGTGCITIADFYDLAENIDLFAEAEAGWLASWIEYLGDKETANKIREIPGELKRIVIDRYNELRDFI
jgi:dienelactone hydrolase